MNIDVWKHMILSSAMDVDKLERLARLLEEQDKAKQVLRNKGYGCTGVGILETAKLVIPNTGG